MLCFTSRLALVSTSIIVFKKACDVSSSGQLTTPPFLSLTHLSVCSQVAKDVWVLTAVWVVYSRVSWSCSSPRYLMLLTQHPCGHTKVCEDVLDATTPNVVTRSLFIRWDTECGSSSAAGGESTRLSVHTVQFLSSDLINEGGKKVSTCSFINLCFQSVSRQRLVTRGRRKREEDSEDLFILPEFMHPCR